MKSPRKVNYRRISLERLQDKIFLTINNVTTKDILGFFPAEAEVELTHVFAENEQTDDYLSTNDITFKPTVKNLLSFLEANHNKFAILDFSFTITEPQEISVQIDDDKDVVISIKEQKSSDYLINSILQYLSYTSSAALLRKLKQNINHLLLVNQHSEVVEIFDDFTQYMEYYFKHLDKFQSETW